MPFIAVPIAVWAGASVATAATVAAVSTTIAIGVAVGAVVGAGMAIIKGGDILKGALTGALVGGVSAGIFSAASAVVSAVADVGTGAAVGAEVGAGVGAGAEVATGVAEAASGPISAGGLETIEAGLASASANAPTAGLMAPAGASVNTAAANLPYQLAGGAVKNAAGGSGAGLFGMSDATSKIYAGIGQGAAQGLGEVGKAMMQGDALKQAAETAKNDEIEKQQRSGSNTPYNTGPAAMSMTFNPQAAYQGASANPFVPNINASAALKGQTNDFGVQSALSQQTANVNQSSPENWWFSHLQPAGQTVNPPQQQAAIGRA